MTYKLRIFTEDNNLRNYYQNKQLFHQGDAGFDLIFPNELEIQSNETKLIKLGIKCAMEDENKNQVSYLLMPRSSIIKTKLRMANSIGLIDAGYRGEICAAVDNIGEETHICNEGDRLFQIVGPNLSPINVELVNTLEELGQTTRGEGGFGSTNQMA